MTYKEFIIKGNPCQLENSISQCENRDVEVVLREMKDKGEIDYEVKN